MIRPILSILAFLLIPFTSISQVNFKKGWIIKNESPDTIKGLIDFRDWELNPEVISFKASDSDQVLRYKVNDCSSFGIEGIEFYERAVVDKYTQPIEITEITTSTKEIIVRDTVFLRCLVNGEKGGLYELTESFKTQFYLKNRGEFQALRYYLTKDNPAKPIVEHNIFRGQLGSLVQGDEKLFRQAKNLKYKEQSLIEFFNNLNSISNNNVKKKSDIKLWVGAGISATKLDFNPGAFRYVTDSDFKLSYSPVFSLGLDMISKRKNGRLFARLGLTYFSSNYYMFNDYEANSIYKVRYHLDQRNIILPFSVNYGAIPLRSNRFIYFGFGVSYNLSSYNRNKIELYRNDQLVETDQYEPQKAWIQMHLNSGIKINESIDANIRYAFDGSFFRYSYFSAKVPTIQATVIYKFKNRIKK